MMKKLWLIPVFTAVVSLGMLSRSDFFFAADSTETNANGVGQPLLTPIDVINEIIKKKCETWPANEFGILQVAKIEDALLVQQLCLNFLPDILRDLAQNPTTDFQKCKEDLKNKITAHFAKHCGRPLSITGAILSAGVEDCLFQKLREILPK